MKFIYIGFTCMPGESRSRKNYPWELCNPEQIFRTLIMSNYQTESLRTTNSDKNIN